jgi:hypothetical protein
MNFIQIHNIKRSMKNYVSRDDHAHNTNKCENDSLLKTSNE